MCRVLQLSRNKMRTALVIWLGMVAALWLAYAPWRPGAAERHVIQSDAAEYHLAAVSVHSNGVYRSVLSDAGGPDNYRPPLFPLLAAAVYNVTGVSPLVMLAVNGALFALCVVMLAALCNALRISDSEAKRWAYVVAGVCPIWIVTSLMYMPDALFTLLMTAFYVLWLRWMERMALWQVITAGGVLGLATLTKPVTLYLPIGLLGLAIWQGMRTRQLVRALACGVTFVAMYVIVLAPWYVRNYKIYQRFSFVSYEGVSLLDFTAANVIRRAYGCDLQTARAVLHERLAERYDLSALDAKGRAALPELVATNVPWAATVAAKYWPPRAEREVVHSLADLSAAEKKLFVAVFKSHVGMYALDSLRGAANIIFMPPWQECMRMVMPEVDAMGLALACVRGDREALADIGWGRVVVAVMLAGWMTGLAVVIASAAVAGVILLFRRGEVGAVLTCLVVIGYFLAIAGPNGEARYRAPLLPLMFPLAGVGVAHLLQWLKRRSLRCVDKYVE